MHNCKGVLEYLLRKEGVRKIIHVKDVSGYTPLNRAVLPRARESLKRVVELGENTKVREDYRHFEAMRMWRRRICGAELFVFLLCLFSFVLFC